METKPPKLETQRLLLRPWRESDAEALYENAKDPAVGPITGWLPHTSVENSREIIQNVLSDPTTWAVVLRQMGLAAGSISLMIGQESHLKLPENEAELGYWLGRPYWGQGLMPEAVRRVQRYAFEELGLARLWCGYYDGNEKSRRVQEKCGFTYHHTIPQVYCALLSEVRIEHISALAKEMWNA